ncbi:hypothetical protein D9M69_519590 [compost metagenome]
MDSAFLVGGHLPEIVQAGLQFGEGRGGAEDQHENRDQRRDPAAAGFVRADQHGLDHLGTALAGQVAQLREQLRAHRVLAEEGACHRDHQDQHGGQREHHVQGQRGALAGRAVRGPLLGGIHQQPADFGWAQGTQQGLGYAHRAKLFPGNLYCRDACAAGKPQDCSQTCPGQDPGRAKEKPPGRRTGGFSGYCVPRPKPGRPCKGSGT